MVLQKVVNQTKNLQVEGSAQRGSPVNFTRHLEFWSGRVFEGVHNHMMELLRKCNFDLQSLRFEQFESGPKLQFDTRIFNRLSNCNFGPKFLVPFKPKLHFRSNSNMWLQCMNFFRHFSGPKFKMLCIRLPCTTSTKTDRLRDTSPIPDKVFNHPGPQLQKTTSGQDQVKARQEDNRIFLLISSWELKVKKSVKDHLQGQEISQETMTFGESERELLAR